MSSNNKAYRRMDPNTRDMVRKYEKELMQVTMAWQAAKNDLHNARINSGGGRRIVSTTLKPEPGGKLSDLEAVVKERAEAVRIVQEARNKYLTEKGLI